MAVVIIIGKNSYIGMYLYNYLERNGKANLIALTSKDCDLLNCEDVRSLFCSLEKGTYSIVLLATINKSVENSFQSFLKNIKMVKNIIDNAKLINIKSIIYFSSVDIYGKNPILPVTENTTINPDTWYGLSKYVCEWMLRGSNLNCPITILRIPGVYGHSTRDKSVIGKMISTMKEENRIYIHGNGQVLRDYVAIDDLCRFIIELTPLPYNGVLNVATGQSRSILEIANLIGNLLQSEYDTVHLPATGERNFDLIFDNRKINEVFPGFKFRDISASINSYL